MLAYQWLNEERDGTPLVALHGMFGRGLHLRSLVQRMDLGCPVLLPDLRNHGASFYENVMNIPVMAEDLEELFGGLGISHCKLLGHSMGAKVALYFSLAHPGKVERLASMDMAPVTYAPRFSHLFQVLEELDLGAFAKRGEVQRVLASSLGDARLAGFLAQSLSRDGDNWNWRFNLRAIQRNGEELRRFPETPAHRQFRGPTLFLHGALSDYMQEAYWPAVIRLFPAARSRAVAGAGHWLHVDRPQETRDALKTFFE